MFLRIESITQGAVWHGYEGRSSSAPDFQRYNLIYGWNASGKTTLSRVFALLTESATRLPSGARARFRTSDEVLDSAKESDRSRVLVRIFNRDFIDANLQQNDYTQAPALFIVGEDNIRLSNRIASLARRRERVASMYRKVQGQQAEVARAREKLATDLARDCANLLGIRDFRAPNLKALHERQSTKADFLLAADALNAAVDRARDKSDFAPIGGLPLVSLPVWTGSDEIARLLSDTPQQTTVKRLADDAALGEWIRAGLRFHEHTDTCAFCGGDASAALEAYAKHFSDEYRRQHAAISAQISRLSAPTAEAKFPHEKDWVSEVRARVQGALGRLAEWEGRVSDLRTGQAELLRQKLANMDSVLVVPEVEDHRPELMAIMRELHDAKDEHNRVVAELVATRSAAAERVKAHFAARYTLDAGAEEAVAFLGQVDSALERIKTVGQEITKQSATANAELQRSSVAASQINVLLRRLLGPQIAVEQVQDNRLRFVRDGLSASNMSDGERTAIALAYFLVSLGQNGHRLEDQVVFVDDPICSLDANHIYDVAFLIIATLKVCRQLFISTHNSEFFNTVKQDWSDQGKFKRDHEAYLVYRQPDGASALSKLPGHLAKFRSDYHHVFYCLRQIGVSASEDVDAYLSCPNLLRRFLEMYLGFRRPTPKGYSTKLDLLFDDEMLRNAVARYVDEGSHSTSTLRLLEFNDFPAMSRGMVKRVLDALEQKDPDHYTVLMTETN